jgi:uncharacterized protein
MNPSDNTNIKMHGFKPRTYRTQPCHSGLISFQIQISETDLHILADRDLSDIALKSVYKYRKYLEEYIKIRPLFRDSLSPVPADPHAPQIIRDMIDSSNLVGVGPMAGVAGAVSQYVAADLLAFSNDIVVENGGDIFIKSSQDLNVGIYSGASVLNMKLTLKIKAKETPLGICTSSGTIGHSLSFGKADAVCIISKSAVLADAAATAVGNKVKKEENIRDALEYGKTIPGVLGVLIIIGSHMGAVGQIELI